jgi:hypothetical protein
MAPKIMQEVVFEIYNYPKVFPAQAMMVLSSSGSAPPLIWCIIDDRRLVGLSSAEQFSTAGHDAYASYLDSQQLGIQPASCCIAFGAWPLQHAVQGDSHG